MTLVRNIEANNSVEIYPVPSSDLINIAIQSVSNHDQVFSIVDILGRELRSWEEVLAEGDNRIELNIGQLPVGTYFIKTAIDGQIVINKFIKN